MPGDFLSVQPAHRHQRPGRDFDVEVLPGVAGSLDGVPGDMNTTDYTFSISDASA